MTERFCKVCRGWHNLEQPWPHNCRRWQPDNRSPIPSPSIIADTMEPVQSMLDGQMYDSKRRLRQTYKDAGVTEVGDDSSIMEPKGRPATKPDRAGVKAAVRKAASQAGMGA